jgi:hypothetical protein
MNWLVALQHRARLRQPDAPSVIVSNTPTAVFIDDNNSDFFDNADLLESGRRHRVQMSASSRRVALLRTSNRMLALFVVLMTVLVLTGAVAWWLHSPSSSSLGAGAAWWQRFFAEHTFAPSVAVAVAASDDSFSSIPRFPAATVDVAANPWHDTLPAGMCENTKQGRLLVTDEHGYVCATSDLDLSRPGCCLPPVQTGFERFSCETCDPHLGCCQTYEFCVSCCLGSENRAPVDALRRVAGDTSRRAARLCRRVPHIVAQHHRHATVQRTQQALFRNCATQ